MKNKRNIHIIEKDICSQFGVSYYGKSNSQIEIETFLIKKNIYITSDEEIKEGVNQWYLDKFLNKPRNSGGSQYGEKQNVIILTTDQDLIKNGVQAIDDEFLEWFVKNPSCEEVEMEKYHGINTSIAEINYISGDGSLGWKGKNDLRDYKIIIPKEETKQHVEFFNLKNISSKNIPSEFNDIINKEFFNLIEEPKQETIEESAEEYYNNNIFCDSITEFEHDIAIRCYIAGAKTQDERMYSEEDMMFAYEQGARLALIGQSPLALHKGEFPTPKEWFKQFKKK